MVRIAAALVLALHGLVHAMGFVVAWRLATLDELTFRTTALNGAVEIGEVGARLLGLAWLAVGPAFIVAAWGVWRDRPWALRVTGAAAILSLAVCLAGLPDAYRGAAIDAAILAVVVGLALVHPSTREREVSIR